MARIIYADVEGEAAMVDGQRLNLNRTLAVEQLDRRNALLVANSFRADLHRLNDELFLRGSLAGYSQRHAEQDDPCNIPIHCYRSEEHTSELQSLMRISYAVFCLKKKKR